MGSTRIARSIALAAAVLGSIGPMAIAVVIIITGIVWLLAAPAGAYHVPCARTQKSVEACAACIEKAHPGEWTLSQRLPWCAKRREELKAQGKLKTSTK